MIPTPKARREKREPRTTIISFRLRASEAAKLQECLAAHPVWGIRSLKQFARMLCVDFSKGKLVYVQPVERRVYSDARDFVPVPKPDCQLEDTELIRSLLAYLKTEESWNKLRFYMLRAGWPKDLLTATEKAKTGQTRLSIARKVLERMMHSYAIRIA